MGLFLALALLKKGISCRVLEQREDPVPDSRSLGIHPVSLDLFDELNITDPFLAAGVKIQSGLAFSDTKKLGQISFESGPKPHRYILACPQFETERILRDQLVKLDNEALVTGVSFESYQEDKDRVTVVYTRKNKAAYRIQCDYLIGCDGKNSLVREQASIQYTGKAYSDTYIMGDFEDTTDFGRNAAVFLPRGGMIECFPLPSGMRRWVAKTDSYISNPTPSHLAGLVEKRISFDLGQVKSTMLSSFGVQHYRANPLVKDRILLAGDAAHVVSPIGGQGMNLGWLGAWDLAQSLSRVILNGLPIADSRPIFDSYASKHIKRTKKVARRAELNMMLGRKRNMPVFRNLLVQALLSPLLKTKAAEMFTMRGLDT